MLIVGSYASAAQPGLHLFDFDPASGALSKRGEFSGIDNPTFIIAHPNGRNLYVVGESGGGAAEGVPCVWALSFDPAAAKIDIINRQPSAGTSPCHLRLDASGRWLGTANYGTGSARIFPVMPDGGLAEPSAHVQHSGSGPNAGRQRGPHAHSVTFDPTNQFVLVADLGIDQVMVYSFDASIGTLTAHGSARVHAGAGPRHMEFHPNGRQVFLANELDSTVTAFDWDAAKGELTEICSVDGIPLGTTGSTAADIHVSADGRRVYSSNRGHNSIASFDIGADGALTRTGTPSCGGTWPRNFGLAPGGRHMLVANQHSDVVSVLALDPATGIPGATVASAPVPGASCILFC